MQVQQEGTMWQTPIKGDFLKRSLNQYQYQYPTPASVDDFPSRLKTSINTDIASD